ncbi:MAG: glycosyltransferase [Bacteroidota bacterium]|nr:glycosyltransferase [Bacteroidota bacterium]
MEPIRFDEVGGWIVILLGVALLVQLYFLLGVFTKLAFHRLASGHPESEPVSVIICARNELKNLKMNLDAVLKQQYPDFQVVVVNDCSWDESGNYLEEIQPLYPHLKVVTLNEQEKYRHGKKFALSLGIKAARHELLLLTDADCKPASPSWIQNMVASYKPDTEIVIGYGAYRKTSGLLNKWIRIDTVFNAIQYLSFALAKRTYMGVGRNLSYKKALFFKNKGFASHSHVMSGDDDLFINQTASASNTRVSLHPDSFTESVARNTFASWLKQKKRHMSTGKYYKASDKLSLGTYFMSIFFFNISLVALLIIGFQWQIILSAWLLRMLIQMIIFGKCMKKLSEFDIIWMVPFFDLAVVLLYPAISISNLLFKDKTWK